MDVIIEGKKQISNLWGKQIARSIKYRLMQYILCTDYQNETLLYNVVTGELILLNPHEKEALNKLPTMLNESLLELIEHHFLVPEEYNERKTVDNMRHILKRMENSANIESYTILPTTGCNARCFYCYESDFPSVSMTEETADRIVDYICSHCGENKRVFLHWFGGEPMVGMDKIDQICQKLQERGISYKSRMTSNASLFTDKIAEHARKCWHLYQIQVTLDGTENTYNTTKSYVNYKGNPFHIVLNNIENLLKNNVNVIVRLNLGLYNKDDFYKLVNELGIRFKDYKYLAVYVGILFDETGYEKQKYSDNDLVELSITKIGLERVIKQNGLIIKENHELPHLEITHCMADSPKSILISPSGDLGKCEHAVFDRLIGNVSSCSLDSKEIDNWKEIRIWKECTECCLYPKCVMLKRCPGAIPCQRTLVEDAITKYKHEMITQYQKNAL